MNQKLNGIYNHLDKSIMKPISDRYILSKLNTNVVLYDDLKNYNNIDDALINNSLIILYSNYPSPVGHWCCVVKRGRTLSYFDSFGRKPDNKKKLNGSYPYLSALLLNSNYDLEYNEYDFQSKETSTCGHHCIVRILFKNNSLEEYQKFMSQFNNDDEVVTAISQMI